MTNLVVGFLHDNFIPHRPVKPVVRENENDDKQGTVFGSTVAHRFHDDDNNDKKEQGSVYSRSTGSSAPADSQLHRSLRGRHVQLLGIGATIGSMLFVRIGEALVNGPLSLLLGFTVWSIPLLCITVSTAEMVSYLPITSPFVRLAGRCCDEALEVMTAWNFWFLCCAQIPFEVTTVNTIIHYWRDDYSPAIPLALQVVLYFFINVFGVAIYGEVEFWLSIGKVLLAVGLIFFTFVTMVGGNPQHDAFGFRYWRDPGPMNVTLDHGGSLGRFQGFVNCVIQGCFTFAGPEYVSTVASETINPRKTLPSAFKQVFWRLSLFFIGGALCVGVLVPYNDPVLNNTAGTTKPGAGGSPYVIAMQMMNINALPDLINGLLITAAFSAGNSYTYCSSRTLYGIALSGHGPRFLTAVTKTGIPMYCVLASLCWSLISFLQLGSQASEVLNWIVNLITSCQLINFCILCFTYLHFYRAVKAQGIDRKSMPFRGWFQPYTAYIGLVAAFVMTFVSTYAVFMPGGWSYKTFLFSYLMIFVDIFMFIGYKLIWRTKWKDPKEVDLITGMKEVDEHEEQYYAKLASKKKLLDDGTIKLTWYDRFFTVIFGSEL